MKKLIFLQIALALFSCADHDSPKPVGSDIRSLPVVVHVLHKGELTGHGTNLSDERIHRQIEILNEDFRRKKGTRGHNNHPDGVDTKIEFVLATQDPNGNPATGIIRKHFKGEDIPDEVPGFEFERYAYFSYWNAHDYINIWIAPYPENFTNIILGWATGPDSNLPGDHLFQKPLPGGAEGIIINWTHFGESDIAGGHNLGRTLTHEMGHYLGLLHTWGGRDCETNDYCDDTPAVDDVVSGSIPYVGCDGDQVMIANYMNYSYDDVMNIFTSDQAERMNFVLENSTNRNSLLASPGLQLPD